MSDSGGQIHLVLPDAIERAACFRAIAAGSPARVIRSFASADAYLDAGADSGVGGVLLFQWVQPGTTSGAALLERIAPRADVMTFAAAHRLRIEEARLMLRAGAHDLLPAPLDPRVVRWTIEAALGAWDRSQRGRALHREAAARLAGLTPRERDILTAVADGLANKAIARRFDLSPRTVEVHRANIMRRVGAASVAELLRLQFIADLAHPAAENPVRNGA